MSYVGCKTHLVWESNKLLISPENQTRRKENGFLAFNIISFVETSETRPSCQKVRDIQEFQSLSGKDHVPLVFVDNLCRLFVSSLMVGTFLSMGDRTWNR